MFDHLHVLIADHEPVYEEQQHQKHHEDQHGESEENCDQETCADELVIDFDGEHEVQDQDPKTFPSDDGDLAAYLDHGREADEPPTLYPI
jgi:hypothetical protein